MADADGIDLDLVALEDTVDPPAPEPLPQTAMDLLSEMAGTATQTPPEPAKTDNPVSKSMSIAEALGGSNPFLPQASPESRTATEAHVKVSNQDSKTVNDLWKAIEPCWKRVADTSTVSVTLEVSFSPLGNLSKPPVIKRPLGANLNDARLRSENQAITALAQCGPYLMAYGQEGVQIQFPSQKR